jgi:signal transduction histidine kinase
VRFTLRAARTADPLMRWLAVAATLGGFARVNYFLFPSLYTAWFSAGDGLRLACFLALFAGGVQETRRLQRALAAAAVLEERRRIARDLHDGVAQDLAFIVQQLRHIAARPDATVNLDALLRAAEGALDESRHAIAALARRAGAPLGEAVATTAREAAEREGAAVEVDAPAALDVPDRTQQEVLRVVREAVINAVRHGGARLVRVQVREQPALCVSVIDDGNGFDVTAEPRDGSFGLAGMAARVESIGGELTIRSEPGRGTEVRVTVP